jgi:LysR family transcriptional regulator, chromosome initiation inhibitor
VHPLGVMRYLPVASGSCVERYLPDGFTASAVADGPSLGWNRDDALQDMLVRKVFRRVTPDRRTSCRPRRASPPQCTPDWVGAYSPRAWPHRS